MDDIIESKPSDFLVKFNSDFQQFVFSNDILVVASAYSIGLATHELILHIFSILAPINLFVIAKFLEYDNMYFGFSDYPVVYAIFAAILSFFFHLIKWLITIALTFLLVEYLLNNRIVGLKSTIKEQQENDFIVSKISAKKDNSTPIKEKVAEIKINDKKDEIIGEKMVDTKQKITIKEVMSSQEIEPFDNKNIYNLSTV
jgi:hypothetical protein